MNPQERHLGAGGAGLTSGDDLFSAYTDVRRKRFGVRHVAAGALGLALLGGLAYGVVTFQPKRIPFRVDTYWGLRTVVQGMSPQEVAALIGPPVGREQRGAQECFQYGRASLREASFILHTLCYGDGKLQDVNARRYNSWVVTRDGAIAPAPLEELPADDEAVASPPAP